MLNPFKKSSRSKEAAETYLRTSRLLLQAIGLHAIEGEPHEYQSFRTAIEGLQSRICEGTPLAESLMAVGATARAMHDYGVRTTRFIKAQNLEWQELVRILIEALSDFEPTSAHSAQLREIHWKTGKAVAVEDIRDLKRLISECLEAIQNEITTKERIPTAITEREPQREKTIGDATSAEAMQQQDARTGLLARCDAEAAIRESRRNGGRSFAAVFVIERLRYINSRFGNTVGDRIMALFLQRLTDSLSAEDRLFRWGESSIVSLLEGRESEGEVRRQIERILFKRLVETFTIKDQSVMLPVSSTWSVVPVAEINCDAITGRLDSFVAQNLR